MRRYVRDKNGRFSETGGAGPSSVIKSIDTASINKDAASVKNLIVSYGTRSPSNPGAQETGRSASHFAGKFTDRVERIGKERGVSSPSFKENISAARDRNASAKTKIEKGEDAYDDLKASLRHTERERHENWVKP